MAVANLPAMRVNFLLGPAGSGKTFRCLADLRARLVAAPAGPPLVLLAPRQATFQLELALLSHPGLQGYTRLRILSFERFAEWLLTRLEVPERRAVSEEGRIMVLRALLHQHHEQLQIFRASSRSPGFARLLSSQLLELQQHRVEPVVMRATAKRLDPAAGLAAKLQDLALLLEHYQAWLDTHQLHDAGTLLERAADALDTATRAADPSGLRIEALWLDGLAELTPQELRLLVACVPFCDEATLAFCLESEPRENLPWLSTWSVISRTFRRCHAALSADERCAVRVEVIGRDAQRSRFTTSAGTGAVRSRSILQQLEAGWTTGSPSSASTAEVARELALVPCPDPEREAVMAAREILKFVRAGNRFRDCAVLLRQLDTHQAGLRRVFTRFQIPFFLDRREPVAHHPLAEFTRSALHTVLYHWRLTDWFAALKSGLTALAIDEVDRLENIALARGWEGATWLQPLAIPEAPAVADECERLRRRVIGPFVRLRESLGEQPGGRALAAALRELWIACDVESIMEGWAAATPEAMAHLTVLEELRAWLDHLEQAFGDFQQPLRDWLPILEAGLNAVTVGVIPPCVDQVLIGAVDRSRNPDLKLVVVLGLNEGLFPQPTASTGLLTETDRFALETATLNLGNDLHLRLGHERYLGYIAFTRARERLILGWSEHDAAGQQLNRSPLVDHVQRLFPNAANEAFQVKNTLEECLHPTELLGVILQTGLTQAGSPQLAEILGAGDQPAGLSGLREQLEHFASWDAAQHQDRLGATAVEQLYGARLRTSASRLEQFAACPFQFFVSAGLRARERDRFEVDARKTGTFLHEVLRQFHEELAAEKRRWRDLAPDAARDRIARIGAEQLSRVAAGVLASQARHRFQAAGLISLLQEFVATAIRWMATYRFDPIAVELGIGGESGPLPYWEISIDDGRTLAFRGSVDRVDAAVIPGRDDAVCLAVMDYKSGNKQLEQLKMRAGLQLQLPAYLAALREVASGSPLLGGKQAIPAGMFYVRLKDATERVSHRAAAPDNKSSKRFEHSGRFSFEWLELFDSGFAGGGSGQFNYRLKKDGQPHGGGTQLIRQSELEQLLAGAKSMLQAMGRDILAGNISVDPYRKGVEIPCTWCDYKPICRIDPWTHQYRPLQPLLEPAAASEANHG